MDQTRIGYYADLFFYPVFVSGLLLYDLNGRGFVLHGRWWLAVLGGAMLWTLVEYLLHRFVYHELAVVKELHGMHHEHPNDFVGAPIWVSVIGFASLLAAFALLWGIEIACGVTTGLVAGYVAYLLMHDAVHRWRLGERSWLRSYRLRHHYHHRSSPPGNFGVTTGVWDVVFGTAIVPDRGARRRSQAQATPRTS